MVLDTAEQMAANQFSQDDWGKFVEVAKEFLDEDEIETLGDMI